MLTPGYPVTPLVFLFLAAPMLFLVAAHNPRGAVLGVVVVLAGLPVYEILRRRLPAIGAAETGNRKPSSPRRRPKLGCIAGSHSHIRVPQPGGRGPDTIRHRRGPCPQAVHVAVKHAEGGGDKHGVVDLEIRRALLPGGSDILSATCCRPSVPFPQSPAAPSAFRKCRRVQNRT